ncbi:MAG: tetratricopeptide repeat protein [Gammaproteobacteria bacterium]|nr:MAG: tetratricopeptide repeat protein [Gammaproteobacteria bacterium]
MPKRQKHRAIALYRALIDDNPALPEPRKNLAMIYLDEGDYDRASQLLVEN